MKDWFYSWSDIT